MVVVMLEVCVFIGAGADIGAGARAGDGCRGDGGGGSHLAYSD